MPKSLFTCAHCANTTTASLLHRATFNDVLEVEKDLTYRTITWFYSLVSCNTCKDISLVRTSETDGSPDDLTKGTLCYPQQSSLPDGLPKAIAEEMLEAQKVERVSKKAYAVMIGRLMELLCKDQSASGRTLQEQLNDLAARRIIPEQLAEAAHTLRALRNFGAHATEYELDEQEVEAMRDFYMALLEYVYVAPAKLAALKATMEKKKGSATKGTT